MRKLSIIVSIILILLGIWHKMYNQQNIVIKDRIIIVEIVGEVNKPGVYKLNENDRINKLLELAGGFNENADKDRVNLAGKLIDGEKITIFSNAKEEKKKDVNELIYNTSFNEWQEISGIGPSTAKKIVDYLKKNPNSKLEDLLNISGIGISKFNMIKDYFNGK